MKRYGYQIEADLALLGWDLAELWTNRRHRFLLNLIDHLPRTSNLAAAMADDDELVEKLPPSKRKSPPLQEWSAVVEKLTLLIEAVRENTAAVARTRPPKPLPRPETAWDRFKARTRKMKHDYILSQVRPKEGKPTMADGPPVDALHSAQIKRGR